MLAHAAARAMPSRPRACTTTTVRAERPPSERPYPEPQPRGPTARPELDAATFTALNPDPWAAYEALTDAANDARIERVEMCHVFDGANNQR